MGSRRCEGVLGRASHKPRGRAGGGLTVGWNDHLPDPDAWEAHVEALADRADDDRKRVREQQPFEREPVSPAEFDKLAEGKS